MNSAEPIPVKSHLVWNEKMVKEKHISAVIPIASKTELALKTENQISYEVYRDKKEIDTPFLFNITSLQYVIRRLPKSARK